jgi:hypothetical protein
MVATDDRQSLIHPFPMIAACAAGSPERLDPFGIYRRLSFPSDIYLR